MENFKVEKGEPRISFVLMYGIALQHYVVARVALVNGLIETWLSMHISVLRFS